MSQEQEFPRAYRETSLPYRLRDKVCTACREAKPRALFAKRRDGAYADRCASCTASGRRAKKVKGGRRS